MGAGPPSALPPMSKPPLPSSEFPPPWTLKGEGIILIYRFDKTWVEGAGLLPPSLQGKARGGLGYVMLVDYQESPVGPYRELLLIPGKFGKKGKQTITHIFVDSPQSLSSGRKNWNIPKELASFHWKKEKNRDHVQVITEKGVVFSAEISHGGLSFPISTSLLPLRLVQTREGKTLATQPQGRGWGKLAKMRNLSLDPQLFPDLKSCSPWLALRVQPFTLQFPIPISLLNEPI